MILEIIQTAGIILLAYLLISKLPAAPRAKKSGRKALIDSCALIDGRIVELAKAGFLPANLEIPEFIISELQLLADGNDSQKRERARYGLSIVQQLQQIKGVLVNINREQVNKASLTDDKLVELAKKIKADLYTTDFNLNQVASIQGVRVLNVNELAHALRPVILPGENINIKVLQVGSSRDQGVGYLDDGTMVVIDNAKADIGRNVDVKITRSHQTVAGRMLFAAKVSARPSVKNGRAGNADKKQKPSRARRTLLERNNKKAIINQREQKLFDAIEKSNR